LEILAKILGVIEKERVYTKTHLMYRANLSFAQMQEYMSISLDLDLVKEVREEDRTFYEITEKGKLFLKAFRKAEELTTFQDEQKDVPRKLRANGDSFIY